MVQSGFAGGGEAPQALRHTLQATRQPEVQAEDQQSSAAFAGAVHTLPDTPCSERIQVNREIQAKQTDSSTFQRSSNTTEERFLEVSAAASRLSRRPHSFSPCKLKLPAELRLVWVARLGSAHGQRVEAGVLAQASSPQGSGLLPAQHR